MRSRWLVAVGVALLGATAARAQPIPPPTPPALPGTPCSAPNQLPPLLPVPVQPGPPAVAPRPGAAPGTEYDPGYLYLPEQMPDRVRRELEDEVCGPPGRWWVNPELDLAWVPTRPAPAALRLRPADPAAPGQTLPGPQLPVAGLSPNRFEAAFGLSAGFWFGDAKTHGFDASLFLRDANTTFGGAAPGMTVEFPNGTRRSVPQVVAFAEPLASSVVGTFPATLGTFFATTDVNYRHKLFCDENARVDALVGYRYAFLGDELYLGERPDAGHDEYRLNRASVSNAFHGGQVGFAGELRAGDWYVAGAAKMAFGVVTPQVTATGVFTGAEGLVGDAYHRLGGLVRAERSTFAVMPAFNVQVGRQLGRHSRVYVGYSFTYLNRTARLGDALNPITTGLALGDFWVQSIGFGTEFRF